MDEVGSALVAIALVLTAVFVPTGSCGHFRAILPAIRVDDRRRNDDLADRVADFVAGHVCAASEAA